MDASRKRHNQTVQPSKSVFLFHRLGIKQHGTKMVSTPDDPREIGGTMAQEVAKKLKLNLDI